MTEDEVMMKALEGLFFSPYDISLYLKDADAKKLSDHLNNYIIQAYRIGKESK